jgi:predicted phage terminase large subunit-like protein
MATNTTQLPPQRAGSPRPKSTSRTRGGPSTVGELTLAERALDDYWAFLDLIEYRGGTKNFGQVHHDLACFVSDSTRPRRMILMPRGHLKSTICSVGYTLWRIWKNPNIRIMVGTASKELAIAFVREIKQYFEDADLQKRVWNNRPHIKGPLIPQLEGSVSFKSKRKRNRWDDENFDEGFTEAEDKKVVWKANALQVVRDSIMKEPTLVATSVNSPDTGFHYDLFIADDVVTFKNSGSTTKRETILRWVADQESVVDPHNPATGLGGEFVLLGTRYFYQDLYGIYSNEDLTDDEREELRAEVGDSWDQDEFAVFRRNIYVNGTDPEDGFLWPERFNEQVLSSIRRRMLKQPNGAKRFASQYLNQVYSEDDVTLDWEQVTPLSADLIEVRPEDGVVRITMPNDEVVQVRPTLAVDPAISQSARADSTAISVLAVTGDRRVILLEQVIAKLSPSETVAQVYELLERYGLRTFWLDSEKLGMALKHTFRDTWQREPRKYFAVTINDYRAVGDKQTRLVNTLEPLFNNGMVYATHSVHRNKQLQQEVCFFGQSGVHDDGLDSIVMGIDKSVATSEAGTGPTRRARTGRERYKFHSLASLKREQASRHRYNSRFGGLR